MSESSQNNTEFQPRKEKEYRLFLIWKALPLEIKKGGAKYLEEAGVDDEELLELAAIKTKLDFGKRYGLNKDTLTDWNRQPVPPEYQDIDWRHWARQLTTRVVSLLFEGITEDKDAGRIKLWLQAVDGYVEETGVNTTVSVETLNNVRALVNKRRNAKVADAATSTTD